MRIRLRKYRLYLEYWEKRKEKNLNFIEQKLLRAPKILYYHNIRELIQLDQLKQ
jgi:hypothetical protein